MRKLMILATQKYDTYTLVLRFIQKHGTFNIGEVAKRNIPIENKLRKVSFTLNQDV
jgi:hypothetical protein